MDLGRADVPALVRALDALGAAVRREFGPLSVEQLNWKPAPDEWSIAQCFDHLVITSAAYVPTVRAIQSGTKRRTAWERVPLLPSLFGPLLRRVLDPDRRRKVQAPPALRPSQSAIDAGILERFEHTNAELARLMEATAPDALRTIVTSPAARFVTYTLLDAYRIIVVHDTLHVRQARDVAAAAGFPRAARHA